jgi:FkbM family methyltransferase
MQTYQTKYGHITCYNNDIVFSSLLRRGLVYEEDIIVNKVVPMLREKNKSLVILDIGGHIGTHTILYSRLLNCKVHTFEPQKKIFDILNKNIMDNELLNCTIYNCAVGHITTTTTMSDMLYDGYDCKIEYDTNKILNYGGIGLGKNGEQVQMINIDHLNLQACDYIKIDVEGAEMLALLGAKNTIEKFKPIIWYEHTDKIVSQEMIESLNIDFEIPSVNEFLQKNGYKIYNLDQYNLIAIYE